MHLLKRGSHTYHTAQTGQPQEKGIGSFRFWTDARRFKGSEEKCIVQKALYGSGRGLPQGPLLWKPHYRYRIPAG